LDLCRFDLVFVGFLAVRRIIPRLILVVLVILVFVDRIGPDHQRDARDALTEQFAFFAEPKAVDAVLPDGRHRHGRSP
jgi:hypothetical protein